MGCVRSLNHRGMGCVPCKQGGERTKYNHGIEKTESSCGVGLESDQSSPEQEGKGQRFISNKIQIDRLASGVVL